jgi:hypothetical protein
MNALRVRFCSAILCMLWAVQLSAEERAQPQVVPIDKEPRHRLAFQNESVRIFDTRVPAGDTTLYHQHVHDSVYVLISGTDNLVNQLLGEPPQRIAAKPGDVFFGAHSTAPRVHRFSNLSADEHQVLDIEIIVETKLGSTPFAILPQGYQSVLENSRVRVSRIGQRPGEAIAGDASSATARVLVVLGGRASLASDSIANPAGGVEFYVGNGSTFQAIRNEGNDLLELIDVEVK